MSVTANGKKTTTQDVGTVWELGVKVTPKPSDDVEQLVAFYIETPTRGIRTVATVLVDGAHVAHFALDEAGEFAATAHVTGEDGAEPATLDGFKATAKSLEGEPTTTSDPAPEPVDGA